MISVTFVLLALASVGATLAGASQPRSISQVDTLFIPSRLSEAGVYQDIVRKKLAVGVLPFSVNTPLWSDGSIKQRYLILPKDSQLVYQDRAAYGYPKGAVFVKNFLIDTIAGDSTSRIYLETRLLIKNPNVSDEIPEWVGFTYKWDIDQADAVLVPVEGLTITVPIHKPLGAIYQKIWRFPGRQECFRCHIPRARQVLGFFTAQLNQPKNPDTSTNQLRLFFQAGLFGKKSDSIPDFSKSPAWASLRDTTRTLEHRARSYFASNCSGCHSPEAYVQTPISPAKHDFNYFSLNVPSNYIDIPTKVKISNQDFMLIASGNPQKSFILLRMSVRDPFLQMPPLATTEVDTLAVRVVTEWIRSLPTLEDAHTPPIVKRNPRPSLNGEVISVPPEWVAMGVQLIGLNGHHIPLMAIGAGRFRITEQPSRGILILKFSNQSYRLMAQ